VTVGIERATQPKHGRRKACGFAMEGVMQVEARMPKALPLPTDILGDNVSHP